MNSATLVEALRSAPLRPVRNLLRPLASAFPLPVAVRVAGGRKLFVDLRSAIGRGIAVRGEFDPAVGGFLADRLRPGAVLADIGANIGYFSLSALELVGATGEVHSFEIDPRSLACLYRTQRVNRLENLFVHGVGLGDHAAIVRIAAEAEMGNTHVSAGARRGGPGFPMLPLDTWEGYFEQRGLDVMKIDVEGAELGVLRGGRRVLERNRPIVLCEAIEANLARFGHSVAALSHFMESIGYRSPETLGGAHDCNLVFEPRR
jgi:FkbM family methyltransferase